MAPALRDVRCCVAAGNQLATADIDMHSLELFFYSASFLPAVGTFWFWLFFT
jgi:hypothetical protein